MGLSPSLPITAKESGAGSAARLGLEWGFSSMQGWRKTMEDAHFVAAGLGGAGVDCAAFGVLDGHGGFAVADFCRQHLPQELAEGAERGDPDAMIAAFERMDVLLADADADGYFFADTISRSGCAAIVCLVRPQVLVVANAGDCRAVLCRGGIAAPLSEDHKPDLPLERERIVSAGGFVEEQELGPVKISRVNGSLSCSRAIGNLSYKADARRGPHEQLVCSTPDVREFAREAEDEFLIVACDGVWDVVGSQDAVDFVSERLKTGQPPSGIMDDLLDRCISPDLEATNGIGGDNMTAMLVVFRRIEAASDDVPLGDPEKTVGEEGACGTAEAKADKELEGCMNKPDAFLNEDHGAQRGPRVPPRERWLHAEIAPYSCLSAACAGYQLM